MEPFEDSLRLLKVLGDDACALYFCQLPPTSSVRPRGNNRIRFQRLALVCRLHFAVPRSLGQLLRRPRFPRHGLLGSFTCAAAAGERWGSRLGDGSPLPSSGTCRLGGAQRDQLLGAAVASSFRANPTPRAAAAAGDTTRKVRGKLMYRYRLKLKVVHLYAYSSAFPHTRTRTSLPRAARRARTDKHESQGQLMYR